LAYSSFLLQPVGPKAGTPGTSAPATQDPTPASGGGAQQQQPNTWILLAPMLVVVLFMFFTSRTQRKKEEATRAKLKKGDKVVSQSGLIGELIDLDDKIAKVKIAPGTNVQMLASSISPFDPSAVAVGAGAADKNLKDLKDAKAAADKKA
jgi:preprotein translocase subunit YajC